MNLEWQKSINEASFNHPSKFWLIENSPLNITISDWHTVCETLNTDLPHFVWKKNNSPYIADNVLFEYQFGPGRWNLCNSKKVYYYLRPFIPSFLQNTLRKIHKTSRKQKFSLNWPIEERYVKFQYNLLYKLMEKKDVSELSHIYFWPDKKDFAFVLTHDIETEEGLRNIPILMKLEKKYGFRSIFNIVPERYKIDKNCIRKIRSDGFEISIHGLKHDGKLFFTQKTFSKRAKKINEYLKKFNAKGFRSPFTHRNPDWMQELECDYDMSFFDTDPYETIPGGTMSIWPFFMGRFVELPYTLPQDSTLFITLREKNIDIWKKKVDWIERNRGMALLNVHPDYIDFNNRWGRKKYPVKLYEEFLSYMKNKKTYWHALPKDAAKWWRDRANCFLEKRNGKWVINPPLYGGNIGTIKLKNKELIFN